MAGNPSGTPVNGLPAGAFLTGVREFRIFMRDAVASDRFATLGWFSAPGAERGRTEESALDRTADFERFLADVERRAFRIARVTLRDEEDALDAVQDAMLQLARRYAHRPAAEWPPLFYRILQNRVRDFQRRRQVRNRMFAWFPGFASDEDADAAAADVTPDERAGVVEGLMAGEALQILERSVAALPARQQQAFMLRAFEGLDVAQTASAMGCTEGSVKTHYSRAVHALREQLGEAW
jgi:RNA polymerase sigma-70 factor (ECF subfamily)